jgi:hypothetical protein
VVIWEDYFNSSPCWDWAYPNWFQWEHAYQASVSIDSPTQNPANDADTQANVSWGGGSAYAFASISTAGNPDLYEIDWEYSIWCTQGGLFVYAAETAILFQIRVHPTTSLTETEVDSNILPDATQLLRTNHGQGDVACPIRFWRFGPIEPFGK